MEFQKRYSPIAQECQGTPLFCSNMKSLAHALDKPKHCTVVGVEIPRPVGGMDVPGCGKVKIAFHNFIDWIRFSCRSLWSLPAMRAARRLTRRWQAGSLPTGWWSRPSLILSSTSRRTLSAKTEEHPSLDPGAGGLLPNVVTLVDYYNIVVEGCFSVLLLKLARVAFKIFWIQK